MGYVTPMAVAKDFAPGDRVAYVPGHAEGNLNHSDVAYGVVTSRNDRFVFVRFMGGTSSACDPRDLVFQQSQLNATGGMNMDDLEKAELIRATRRAEIVQIVCALISSNRTSDGERILQYADLVGAAIEVQTEIDNLED